MKVSFEKEQIIEGLQKAAAILPSKAGAAYLRSLWLKAAEDQISIMATDANLEFIGVYAAQTDEPGLVGVQGKAFVDLVRQLPSGRISLTLDKEANIMLLKQGRKSYKLPVNGSEWFQDFSAFPQETPVLWSGDILMDILERIPFCIDDDDTREATACICFKAREAGKIDICGLNGHQFALISFIQPELCEKLAGQDLLIQKKYLPDIKKWLSPDEVEINFSDKRLYLKGRDGSEQLSVPRVLYNYPDYNIFMSKLEEDGISRLNLSRKEAIEALGRILVFNTESDRCVFMEMTQTELKLSAQGIDVGSALEELEVEYVGDLTHIAFPTRNLMEIFGHFTSDRILMDFTGAEGPCGIRGSDPTDKDYLVIIMPMKVTERAYFAKDEN